MGDKTEKSDEKPKLDPTIDFIAGTVAGIAGLVIAYPFDTVKVRFQSPETSVKYRSTFHAFSTIVREEKFRGLYKGIASPMISCAPLNGLVFSSYRLFMRVQLKSEGDEPTIAQIGLAGIGSGVVASTITCPIELIKIRQQNMLDQRPSAREVALDIVRRNGLRGLYRGLTATALRDFGYGSYFATYEATCRYFSRRPPSSRATSNLDQYQHRDDSVDHSSLLDEVESGMQSLSWPVLLLAGGLAGVNGWLATFVFDVVKTRVQSVDYRQSVNSLDISQSSKVSHTAQPVPHPYRTTWTTIVNSYRSEGLTVFFRGLSPTLIRAVPVNMATFGVFEGVVHLLS